MVTRRIAEGLLRRAARRWPAASRDEMHREWTGELHALAEEGSDVAMLRYALSLAVARPPREPVTAAGTAPALGRALRLLALPPLTAVVLCVAGVWLGETVVRPMLESLPGGDATRHLALVPIAFGLAVALALMGRWWTIRSAGPGLLIAATLAPWFTIGCLIYLLTGQTNKLALHTPAYVLFFGGMAVLLSVVDRLAGAGRRTAAWLLGAIGSYSLVTLAVPLPILLSSGEDPSLATLPLWPFAALSTEVDLEGGPGMIGMTAGQIHLVGDASELDIFLFLFSAGIALGALLARRATAAPAQVTPAPSAA